MNKPTNRHARRAGARHYELTNHLGNVLAVIADRIDRSTNRPELLQSQAYEPFGRTLANTAFFKNANNKYRFGFNGQERETEINANILTAEYWEYDTRLGRRWNIDPRPIVGISPYAYFANSPILFADKMGDTSKITNHSFYGTNENGDRVLNQESSAVFDNDPGLITESIDPNGNVTSTYQKDANVIAKAPEKGNDSKAEKGNIINKVLAPLNDLSLSQGNGDCPADKTADAVGNFAGKMINNFNPVYSAGSFGYMLKTGLKADGSNQKAEKSDYVLTGASVLVWGAGEVTGWMQTLKTYKGSVILEGLSRELGRVGNALDVTGATQMTVEEVKKHKK